MRRRQFLGVLGGAAAAWPVGVRAQQSRAPVIGFFSSRSYSESTHLMAAFHQGLKESGYTEGQNVTIEYRWGEGRNDRVPAMVSDLVRRQVSLIFAGGSGEGLAAKAATRTIPIVFTGGSDPVAIGLVSSLNHPEGNVTGATIVSHMLGAKRLEVLRQLIPNAGSIAILFEPNNPSAAVVVRDTQAAARAFDLQATAFAVENEQSLEAAFAAMVQQRVSALFIGGGPILGSFTRRVVALAAHHRLPAMYSVREYVEAGGLMSYGSSYADVFRQGGVYAGRILKGERPSDLPVLQPTKFDLIINLKTARALDLSVPDKLIALADEVIE